MTDVTIMLFITAIAFILMVLNFWMRQGPIAIIAALCFFIVAAYCMTQYYSGDPDYGIWTWAFVFVAIIGGVISALTPNYFNKKWVDNKEDDKSSKTSVGRYIGRQKRYFDSQENSRKLRP